MTQPKRPACWTGSRLRWPAPLTVLTYQGRGFNHAKAIDSSTPLKPTWLQRSPRFSSPWPNSHYFSVTTAAGSFPSSLHSPYCSAQQVSVRPSSSMRSPLACRSPAPAGARPGANSSPRSGAHSSDPCDRWGPRPTSPVALPRRQRPLDVASSLGSVLSAGTSRSSAEPGLVAQAVGRPVRCRHPGSDPPVRALRPAEAQRCLNPRALLLAVPSNFGLQDINFLPGLAGLYMGFLPRSASWPSWLFSAPSRAGQSVGSSGPAPPRDSTCWLGLYRRALARARAAIDTVGSAGDGNRGPRRQARLGCGR
jgi:hypothetical protein